MICNISVVDSATESVLLSHPACEQPPHDQSRSNGAPRSFPQSKGIDSALTPALARWTDPSSTNSACFVPTLEGQDSSASSLVAAVPIRSPSLSVIGVLYLVGETQQGPAVDEVTGSALLALAQAAAQHLSLVESHHQCSQALSTIQRLNAFLEPSNSRTPRPAPATPTEDDRETHTIGEVSFQVVKGNSPNNSYASTYQEDRKSRGAAAPASDSANHTAEADHESSEKPHTVTLQHQDDSSTRELSELFTCAAKSLSEAHNLGGAVFLDSACARADAGETAERGISDAPAAILGSYSARPSALSDPVQPANVNVSISQLRLLARRFPDGALFKRVPKTKNDVASEAPGAAADSIFDRATQMAYVPFSDFPDSPKHVVCFAWVDDNGKSPIDGSLLYSCLAFGRTAVLRSISAKATAEDRIKSRFISSVTHELRSPLHGILGGIEFLRSAPQLKGFEKHILDTIESCGRTLLDTIENVLWMSGIGSRSQRQTQQIEPTEVSGKEKPESEQTSFEMVPLIEDVIMSALLGHITLKRAGLKDHASAGDESGQAKSIMFRSASSKLLMPRLPQVVIATDWKRHWLCSAEATAVRRIVLNLFANALKFTTSGHIVILSKESDEHDRTGGGGVSLVVSDSGSGMSHEFLEKHAGLAFKQEDEFAAGTGLGLHLTMQVVDSLGGKLQMSSQEDVGTSSEVYIPSSRFEDASEAFPTSFQAPALVTGKTVL